MGLLLAAMVARPTVQAQSVITELPRFQVSGHFNLLFPRPPIRRFLDPLDSGYDFEALYRLQHNRPVLAGLYWSEMWLSRRSNRYTDWSGGSAVDIRERASSRRLEGGLTVGYYPEFNWALQPYIQGQAGFALFRTASVLVDTDEGEEIERINEQRSSAPAYGLCLGAQYIPKAWWIRADLRLGFRANPSARFMAYDPGLENTTHFPINSFSTFTAAGHWWYASLGVTVLLGDTGTVREPD